MAIKKKGQNLRQKLALGLIWDLFLSWGKSHEKVDTYDASFFDLESSLHLVAVILLLLL